MVHQFSPGKDFGGILGAALLRPLKGGNHHLSGPSLPQSCPSRAQFAPVIPKPGSGRIVSAGIPPKTLLSERSTSSFPCPPLSDPKVLFALNLSRPTQELWFIRRKISQYFIWSFICWSPDGLSEDWLLKSKIFAFTKLMAHVRWTYKPHKS